MHCSWRAVFLQAVGRDEKETHRARAGRSDMGSDARVRFRKFQESFGLKAGREFVRLNDSNYLNGRNVLNLDFNSVLSTTMIYTHVLNRGGKGGS